MLNSSLCSCLVQLQVKSNFLLIQLRNMIPRPLLICCRSAMTAMKIGLLGLLLLSNLGARTASSYTDTGRSPFDFFPPCLEPFTSLPAASATTLETLSTLGGLLKLFCAMISAAPIAPCMLMAAAISVFVVTPAAVDPTTSLSKQLALPTLVQQQLQRIVLPRDRSIDAFR